MEMIKSVRYNRRPAAGKVPFSRSATSFSVWESSAFRKVAASKSSLEGRQASEQLGINLGLTWDHLGEHVTLPSHTAMPVPSPRCAPGRLLTHFFQETWPAGALSPLPSHRCRSPRPNPQVPTSPGSVREPAIGRRAREDDRWQRAEAGDSTVRRRCRPTRSAPAAAAHEPPGSFSDRV